MKGVFFQLFEQVATGVELIEEAVVEDSGPEASKQVVADIHTDEVVHTGKGEVGHFVKEVLVKVEDVEVAELSETAIDRFEVVAFQVEVLEAGKVDGLHATNDVVPEVEVTQALFGAGEGVLTNTGNLVTVKVEDFQSIQILQTRKSSCMSFVGQKQQ